MSFTEEIQFCFVLWKAFPSLFCCPACLKINGGVACSFSGAARDSCTWSSASPKTAAISWARTALHSTPSLKWSTITPHTNFPSKEPNTCPCSFLCWFKLSDWSEHCSPQCYGRKHTAKGYAVGNEEFRHNQQQHTLTFWSHVFNCTTASGWGHQLLKWNMSDQIIVRSVHMLFHFFNNTFRDLLLVFSRCYSPLGRCISRPNVYWSISSLLGWADGPLYFYSCCKRHLNIDVYDYPLFKVCKAFWL